jgi:hypothetical protein
VTNEQYTSRSEWLNTLHAACRMLCSTPADVIGTMSVTAYVAVPPDAACSLAGLARRIAEEYDLVAQAQSDGDLLTVRLDRPKGGGQPARSTDERARTKGPHIRVPLIGAPLRIGWQLVQGVKPGNQYVRIPTSRERRLRE